MDVLEVRFLTLWVISTKKRKAMSYTQIIQLWPGTNRMEDGPEFSNSHGTAPHIWEALCDYYMNGQSWLTGNNVVKRLWEEKLRDIRRPRAIPHQVAYVLVSYDRVYVKAENFIRLAKDLEQFFRDFPGNPEWVDHWPSIIKYLRSKPNCEAIGFYWTSVGDNYWELPDQECCECERPYDPPRDFNWEEPFEIYEELKEDSCMRVVIAAVILMLCLPSGASAATETIQTDIVQGTILEPKKTKWQKVKSGMAKLFHPAVVAYSWNHEHIMVPVNDWSERHTGLIQLGGTCGNFGINALLGAKKF